MSEAPAERPWRILVWERAGAVTDEIQLVMKDRESFIFDAESAIALGSELVEWGNAVEKRLQAQRCACRGEP